MGILDKTPSWNTGIQIATVFAVGLITIGAPILTVNLLGIAERGAFMELTWQEFAGVGGFFFIYTPAMFISWVLSKRKRPKL